ncbi:MAG TPA: GNAT family protein [Bacteroidales bacterium]
MQQIPVDHEIVLKELSLSSAGVIFQSIDNSRQYLSKWLPFVEITKSQADTEKFIQSVNYSEYNKKEKVFEIWYLEKFAGLLGLKDINENYRKLELGYWLDEKMQSRGIMTRSCKQLIKHIFGSMQMNRITVKVAVGNPKSAAIPKKLGFHFEGVEREGEALHGKFVDLEIYSLLKKDMIIK